MDAVAEHGVACCIVYRGLCHKTGRNVVYLDPDVAVAVSREGWSLKINGYWGEAASCLTNNEENCFTIFFVAGKT